MRKDVIFWHFIIVSDRKKAYMYVCIDSLVTVVMEAVIAAQCSQGAQSDGIGEENLGAGINPHL